MNKILYNKSKKILKGILMIISISAVSANNITVQPSGYTTSPLTNNAFSTNNRNSYQQELRRAKDKLNQYEKKYNSLNEQIANANKNIEKQNQIYATSNQEEQQARKLAQIYTNKQSYGEQDSAYNANMANYYNNLANQAYQKKKYSQSEIYRSKNDKEQAKKYLTPAKNTYQGQYNYYYRHLIPEPSSSILLIIACSFFAYRRKR